MSLSTTGRERTTSSPQPGPGDKGVRTGSRLQELRSEQPGPGPAPALGRACLWRWMQWEGGPQAQMRRSGCPASRGAPVPSVLPPTGLSFPALEALGVPAVTQSFKRPPRPLLGTGGVGPGACPRGCLQTVNSRVLWARRGPEGYGSPVGLRDEG